jgi:transposase
VAQQTLARTEKKAAAEQRTIVFVDESGFQLLPAAVYTWARRGRTPVLKYPMWKHLSVISAITPGGELYTRIQDSAFNGESIVRFLKHLLRHIPGKLLLIWDGLPAHRSDTVKAFLHAGAARRLLLERLPGYAPELNPDEAVWSYLKTVEMRNLCCNDLDHLKAELRKAIARLRRKETVIRSFTIHALPESYVQ